MRTGVSAALRQDGRDTRSNESPGLTTNDRKEIENG